MTKTYILSGLRPGIGSISITEPNQPNAIMVVGVGDVVQYGPPEPITSLLMDDLEVIEFDTLPPDRPLVFLRYSDDAGASWSNRLEEFLGWEGEFANNLQWQRLGTARYRVFELSWSTPCLTALTGIFVNTGSASS
jgi:hypothetical protein